MEIMLNEFKHRSSFFNGIRQSEKTVEETTKRREGAFINFAKLSIRNGATPMPLLSKLKNGVLYFPSSYKIQEGLALSMNLAIKNLVDFDKQDGIVKAVFEENHMNDKSLSILLKALKQREEFYSLNCIGS